MPDVISELSDQVVLQDPHEIETLFQDSFGEEVPANKVQSVLKSWWKHDGVGTRASLMNLVVLTRRLETMRENAKLMEDLTGKNACRVILVLNDEGPPVEDIPKVRVWVKAHCRLRGGKKSICSEQLAFWLRNGSTSLVRNTVFANVDSDLPLIFWWRGELTDLFEERLYRVIDRLIVDSARWNDPINSLQILQDAYVDTNGRFAVHDLSWTRTHHLRVAMARLFEDADAAAALKTLEQIEIGGAWPNEISKLMLASWLAASLEATLEGQDAQGNLIFKREGLGTYTLTLKGSLGGKSLRGITLTCREGQFEFFRSIESSYLHSKAVLSTREWESVEPADLLSEVDLVSEQLQRAGANRLYMKTVPILQGILRLFT